MKVVQVQVVTHNSRADICSCLHAVLAQSYPALRVIVLDNGSTDGTAELVQIAFPDLEVRELHANLGYAKAHNIGFAVAGEAEYLLPLNPDCRLEAGCVSALVAAAESHPRVGSLQPKLFRAGGQVLDTTGIVLTRSRRTFDRGQGEKDRGQYDNQPRVFAANGAAPIYRRAMLEELRMGEEYFDVDFWAYKEDVDLGWRARLMGWEALFVPEARGEHDRGWRQGAARRHVSRTTRVHSLKNRYLCLLKNDRFPPPITHWPALLGYEVVILGGVILREPFLLEAYWQALRLAPRALAKRRHIWAHCRVTAGEMSTWTT